MNYFGEWDPVETEIGCKEQDEVQKTSIVKE
jgi:hypothetical protein